ncbi:MAG TPA: RDD family protein [Fluviicola sp.]|nr:RDD family protein [Fluviicola sp.]
MRSKPLNFLFTFARQNQWVIALATVLLLFVKILGQLPNTGETDGYLDLTKIPEMIDRVVQYAIFGRHENSLVEFYGQLTYCLTLLTWILLIVGVIRYYSEKRSVTVLKLIAVFVLWQGLFDALKLSCFALFNPFEGLLVESYFSAPLIVFKIALPALLSVFLLGMLSPTQAQSMESTYEVMPVDRWQRGFHYVLDRIVIWFCGYNTYLMISLSSDENLSLWVGIALLITQLIALPLVSEWLFGVTLTKLITGTEVVRKDGKPITVLQAIARAFIRILPFGWLSVFGKEPWIDSWTGTEVRYFCKDEPLLRLHKCVQLIMGILFFFGAWSLLATITYALGIYQLYPFNESRHFSFFALFICLFFVPFLQSFWLATVVNYYRSKRAGVQQHSHELLLQAFYCWAPILNFYYLGAYLDEITSHMEHLNVSEEDNDRIATKIRRFSNTFGLVYLFISGLFAVLFISTSSKNTLLVTGLIFVSVMAYAFFAWDLSRSLKNTVVRQDSASGLIDDLG